MQGGRDHRRHLPELQGGERDCDRVRLTDPRAEAARGGVKSVQGVQWELVQVFKQENLVKTGNNPSIVYRMSQEGIETRRGDLLQEKVLHFLSSSRICTGV